MGQDKNEKIAMHVVLPYRLCCCGGICVTPIHFVLKGNKSYLENIVHIDCCILFSLIFSGMIRNILGSSRSDSFIMWIHVVIAGHVIGLIDEYSQQIQNGAKMN